MCGQVGELHGFHGSKWVTVDIWSDGRKELICCERGLGVSILTLLSALRKAATTAKCLMITTVIISEVQCD